MIRNLFIRRLFTNIKKSSYDIQKQYSAYKLKRKLQFDNSFKKFNLNPPTQISSKYQQPKILLSDISNLKQYSHTYPDFLMKQLKDPKSKIHESVSSIFDRIYLMKTDQGLQLLLFLDKWGYIKQYQISIAKRWVSNQTFNFQQIWQLLKSNLGIQQQLQNVIIKYLQIIQPKEYSYLFKSLNYYRLKNIGSQQFFIFVQKHIIRNIQLMTGTQLSQLISHYCNNINENMESKLNILESVSNRMKIILPHLSANELITVLFCYLKLDMLNKQIGQSVIKKIIQTLPQWKQQQIRQLMEVSTNLGKKQQTIIKQLIRLFNNNKISIKLLPSLYSLAIQYAALQKDFVRKVQEKLLENVHNMDPQNVSKSCWAFAVVPRAQNKFKDINSNQLTDKLFFRKVQEIIEGGLRDYDIKNVTRIVWALGTKQYKLDAPFWGNIESWLQQQLSKQTSTLRDVSLILWAYTNRIPLKQGTLQIIKNIIIDKIHQSQGFDLTMICWYFSQINQTNKQILSLTYKQFKQNIDSMQYLQILKCLRWFIPEGVIDNQALTKFVKRVSTQYRYKSYFVLLNTLNILTSIKIDDKSLLIETVIKVDEHIKTLKQMQSIG